MLLQLGALRVHLTGTTDRNIALNTVLIIVSGVAVRLATTWLQ